MATDLGAEIWRLAGGGAVDNSVRNSFERRILAVWDAATDAGRGDIADLAQREREWLYSSAYNADAARERVETLEYAAAAMLTPQPASPPARTSRPPARPSTTTTTITTRPAPAPAPTVRAAGVSPLVLGLGGLAVVVAGFLLVRGKR